MKLVRKVVDERQEHQMMRVERSSFYVMFLALGASIPVQVIMGCDMRQIAGETIVLLFSVVWMVGGHIRNGSWGYFTKPGIKSYSICSLTTVFVYAIASSLYRYLRHNISLEEILPAVVINSTVLFVLMFIVLFVLGTITKKHQKKLQDEYTDDE